MSEDQGGDHRLARGADRAAADQERAARQPVREHAAEQQEDDAREGVGADHQPERADRASGVEHGERQGDRRHPTAEQVGRRTDEEVAERAVAQRRQGGRHAPDRRHWAARPSKGCRTAHGQVFPFSPS
ncbi:hypothetical protein [Streptomyces sp. SID5643]|uniref:hypothetical protein n=1 Tax=Streptomyces sp. SID5643 TaxID=2690307 RepID=UPI001928857E|nr:hypothetical protein [Streptomyces sp. SID5643]